MTTEFVRHDLAKTPSSTSEPDRVRVIREGVASYLPDIDPEETAEWLESFDELLDRSGPSRARYLMLRLLERAGEQRIAIPALLDCQRRGIRVPRDIAICGFGDYDLATIVDPQLTTVRVEAAKMGTAAAQLILRRLKDGDDAQKHVDVGYHVLVRGSA